MINPDQKKLAIDIDPHTPALDVIGEIDLAGKTAIVTGGYSGIGLETVRALASAGTRVIVPARNRDKATNALASIAGAIEIADMDLADQTSVRRFANNFTGQDTALHLLINNAGVMACPLSRTEAGWETQFGVNHLGTFALTSLLLPRLTHGQAK